MSTRAPEIDYSKTPIVLGAATMQNDAVRIIRPQVTLHCRECEIEGDKPLTAGRVINGQFVYEVKHHGKTHVQRIDVQYLLRLLAA